MNHQGARTAQPGQRSHTDAVPAGCLLGVAGAFQGGLDFGELESPLAPELPGLGDFVSGDPAFLCQAQHRAARNAESLLNDRGRHHWFVVLPLRHDAIVAQRPCASLFQRVSGTILQ